MKTIIILFIVLFLTSCQQQSSPTDSNSTAVVQRGNLEVVVKGRGFLSPLQEKIIRSPANRVISWIEEEGAQVKKGDKVLELESSQLVGQMLKYQSRFVIHQAESERASADSSKRINAAERGLHNAKSQLNLAQITLENAKSGAFVNELDTIVAQHQLMDANIESSSKNTELTRSKDLVNKGAESREILETKDMELKVAQLGKRKAKFMLERILQGANTFDIRELELTLKLAEHNLGNAHKFHTAEKKRANNQRRKHRKRVRRIKRKFKARKRLLESMTVYAPKDGIILHKIVNGKKVEAGMQTWKGLPVLSIPNLKRMKVVIKVDENLITYVKKGQIAYVTVPGRTQKYKGKVTKIEALAKDAFDDYDRFTKNLIGEAKRRTFDVTIALDKQDSFLLPGIFVDAKIIIDKQQDQILCPVAAIQDKKVLMVTPQGQKVREVKTGVQDKFMAVIEQGLSVGDIISLDVASLKGDK